tara:strand:- start:331 stop:2121 length:1791 start_codon:yes stop_codon:yes gene_type:complete
MCGFTGSISFEVINDDAIQKSNLHSLCRGPDNSTNIKGNEDINYNFWFNRLAIVDLSEKANQPMVSNNLDSIIMFNGEIYNAKSLRARISETNYEFKTSHSDTETLFAGLETYGISFISQLDGQFSFFYLNKKSKKIYFARDRVGQKPLYISSNRENIIFASNLKSILELRNDKEVDVDSVNQYLAYGVNFSPRTLFTDIYKVPSANYIEIDYSNGSFETITKEYWNLRSHSDDIKYNQDEFEQILSDSISKRMIADVKIANFLSGGLDSTSIIKNLNEADYEINTFSVIVGNKKFNEKKYIQEVVNRYQTNHQEVFINEDISNEIIYESIKCLDEPYGDPSIVPSYYLSKLISSEYKVAISGDGGDELLGGYHRLKNFLKSKNSINNSLSGLYSIYPALLGTGTKLKSLSSDIFESYVTYIEDLKFLNLISNNNLSKNSKIKALSANMNYKDLLELEYKYYLADQMMFKVDRTSMASSLEVRSPLVDHKLIEYIFSHSTEYTASGVQKEPLHSYLSQDFHSEFLDRPKQGFVFDYKNWVYENFSTIKEVIDSSEITEFVDINNLYKLRNIKTRVNALRIWRVYVLASYLIEVRDL